MSLPNPSTIPANHIILRLVDSGGVITSGINFLTNSEWPHCEMLSRRGTWVGAHLHQGVVDNPYDYVPEPVRDRWYALPVTADQYEAEMDRLDATIGTKYDLEDIFGLLVHVHSLYDQHRLICSRHVYQVHYETQVLLNALYYYSYLITPETLHLSPYLIGKMFYDYSKPKGD